MHHLSVLGLPHQRVNVVVYQHNIAIWAQESACYHVDKQSLEVGFMLLGNIIRNLLQMFCCQSRVGLWIPQNSSCDEDIPSWINYDRKHYDIKLKTLHWILYHYIHPLIIMGFPCWMVLLIILHVTLHESIMCYYIISINCSFQLILQSNNRQVPEISVSYDFVCSALESVIHQ